MSQSFIDALMHFLSLLFLPLPGKKINNLRQKLEDYFDKAAFVYPPEECIKIYSTYSSKYFFEFSNQSYQSSSDFYNIQKHLLHEAALKAQGNLYLQERLLIILALIEFSEVFYKEDDDLKMHIQELSRSLNLEPDDYIEAYNFITGKENKDTGVELSFRELPEVNEDLEGVWVEEHLHETSQGISHHLADRIRGQIVFHYFKNYNYLVFRFESKFLVFLNEVKIYTGFFYTFRRKDILQFEGLEPIVYNEIETAFHISTTPVINLAGDDLSYRFKKSNYSIKTFSFSENSGQLIGIIGNNGAGKSTILKLISNQLDSHTGKLYINGSNLIENRFKLSPTLAFVPQSDLIIPDLTVYENLLYQAHLCLGNLGMKEIDKRIWDTLNKLQLTKAANLKAGNDNTHRLNNFKRVCLRIALELIRNPYVIFLDEPICSLSYSDSRRIISMLKEEAYLGKLIFITAQIPSAEIFNMLDRVWLIDQDGYLIYNGEPSRCLSYFRNTGLLPYYFIPTDNTQLNPEDVIKVVETKKIQSDGSVSDERMISPGTWYDAWKAEYESTRINSTIIDKPVPVLASNLPGIEKQFIIYLFRNFRIKFSNVNYLMLNFLGIPFVAILLALLTRIFYGQDYDMSENEYIPLYIFLSVNFILFSGLLTGAEEVYRERSLIKRDNYLYLSMFSYKNAKILFLFTVSFIQTFLFSLAGNLVLEIHGMNLIYALAFFSLSALANLMSLTLSSSIRRLNLIYILIPFIIFPNFLFGGYLIKYDSYSRLSENDKPIPLIAELTPTRWAYEALVFEQFASNPYNKNFYNDQKILYQSNFVLDKIVPRLEDYLNECTRFQSVNPERDSLDYCLTILSKELRLLGSREEIAPFEKLSLLNAETYDSLIYNDIYGYLFYLRLLMENTVTEAENQLEATRIKLAESMDSSELEQFIAENHNNYIENYLTGGSYEEMVIAKNQRLLKKGVPVYMRPASPLGRAQFFSPEKKVNQQYISTFRFNLTMIWVFSLVIYLIYLTDGLKYLFRND